MSKFIFFVLLMVLGLTLASTETYPSDGGWARLLGTSDYDSGIAIAVDSNGNSYITGRTRGDLDGNTNAGGQDILITKYDSNGNKEWTRSLGTSTWERGLGIALDSNSNSYITGKTQGNLDGRIHAGSEDIFVAKYDSGGNKKWTRLFGTSALNTGRSIALDANGNSYITGFTYGDLDGNTNAGPSDIFVTKYDSSGNKKWTRLFGTSDLDFGIGIAVDSDGNRYVTGSTQGDLEDQSNAGGRDILVWKTVERIGGAMPWQPLLLLDD